MTPAKRPTTRPGYQNYLIYADETGIDGQLYYAFGSLWVPNEARGRLTGFVKALKTKHRLADCEIKWNATSRRTLPLYKALVEEFFRREWLMFHCIIVRKAAVDMSLHARGLEEAREKHFGMFIRSKLKVFARGGGKQYHLRLDPFPSRYPKTDEVIHKIANAEAKKALGYAPIATTRTVDSKKRVGVQLADLLLGAVLSDWQLKAAKSPAKVELRKWVAEHLGWPDLHHDTFPESRDPLAWKFNIWLFCDPRAREMVTQRRLRFKYPVSAYRPRRAA